MNRTRILIGLFLAIVLAAVMATFVYRAFQRAGTPTQVFTQQLVVARVPLQIGARIEAADVQTINWPKGSPLPGMISSPADAIGRALITPVVINEPILESKLAPREAGAGLPATIPEGMRALSIAVNDVVGVAGFVIPGTFVDVLVTGQIPGASSLNVTRTILENVRVLAAGQKIEQDRDGKPQTVPVVTLLVSPSDAALLTMASTEGKIQLALRNTIDGKTPTTQPVYQAVIFGAGAPAPAPSGRRVAATPKPVLPPPPYTVEIITGGKRETKSFPNQNPNPNPNPKQ